MLRFGIGAAFFAAVAAYVVFWWLPKHDAEIYTKARNEIARALQKDAAEKERLAIEADEALTPTPEDPAALAALCDTDRHCRDGKAAK